MQEKKRSMPRWVKLRHYCEMTGDTPDAVHARRRKGVWADGVQCKLGPDGNVWICPEAVDAWIEGRAAQEGAEA